MENKEIEKLKKKMESGAKSIALGDKAIEAIRKTQDKVVEDFNNSVLSVIKKAEEGIALHQATIDLTKGLVL